MFFPNFITHQRKGGIHEIYRSFMGTPGWFRLTGVRSIKISADQGVRKSHPAICRMAFLLWLYLKGFAFIRKLYGENITSKEISDYDNESIISFGNLTFIAGS